MCAMAGGWYSGPMSEAPADVVSVADLARTLKRSVEGVTGRQWVDGEIASFKRAASGHVYFTLKDPREDAALECVMYRMDALRVRAFLREGAHIQALGRATLWAPRGRLQLVLSQMRPVGLGSLLEQLERLKAKLREEGLFERSRKRALPSSPSVVGIITSAHGAALQDIVTVAFRRGRAVLVLAPALVQGEGAPESLLAALNKLERHPDLDVLIIGRGGGSADDLMAFNDERVVRRIASFRVPTVSAVGHEVDTTLADLAADVRAATPSQAAELVVPEWAVRSAQLLQLQRQLLRAIRGRLQEDGALQSSLRSRISDPRFVLAQRQQEVDEMRLRAERVVRRQIAVSRARHQAWEQRLAVRHPRVVLLQSRASLGPLPGRAARGLLRQVEHRRRQILPQRASLAAALKLRLQKQRAVLVAYRVQLEALSPLTVLSRGYAIVRGPAGQVLSSAQEVITGQRVDIRLHSGSLTAEVLKASSNAGQQEG